MNYENIYEKIIQKARSENRKKFCGVYYEQHHIQPKCLGGEGYTSQWKNHPNIVLLTQREHFFCHQLLTKIYPGRSMTYQLFRLACDKQNNYCKKTSREYQKIKEAYQKERSKQNKELWPNGFFFGKTHSEETKQKLSKSLTGRKFNRNKPFIITEKMQKVFEFRKGKSFKELYGEERQQIISKKLSESKKGKPQSNKGISPSAELIEKRRQGLLEAHKRLGENFISEEGKKRIYEANKNKKLSEETKKRISESRKGKLCGEQNPFFGKKHTEESLQKMRESQKGKVPWNKGKSIILNKKCCKKIKCITTNTIFNSYTDACRFYNLQRSSLIRQQNKNIPWGISQNGEQLFWELLD